MFKLLLLVRLLLAALAIDGMSASTTNMRQQARETMTRFFEPLVHQKNFMAPIARSDATFSAHTRDRDRSNGAAQGACMHTKPLKRTKRKSDTGC